MTNYAQTIIDVIIGLIARSKIRLALWKFPEPLSPFFHMLEEQRNIDLDQGVLKRFIDRDYYRPSKEFRHRFH